MQCAEIYEHVTVESYLGRVGIELAVIIWPLWTYDFDFIHTLACVLHVGLPEHIVDGLQKLDAVSQQLLADALAGAVDGDFDARRRVHERCDEQTHGNRLAEAPLCACTVSPRAHVY